MTRDVDELYEALIAARIPVAEPPATRPTGERELCLVDSDGHTMIARTNTVWRWARRDGLHHLTTPIAPKRDFGYAS